MNSGRRVTVVSFVLVGVLLAFAVPARAALTSEASTTWIEYGNTRAHGVFVGDVGGTSGPEVVTAGEAVTDSTGTVKAQLRVYEHSGTALTLKDSAVFQYSSNSDTVWYGVSAADVGGGTGPEIVTVGYTSGGSDPKPIVKVWTYDGSRLSGGASWTINDPGEFRSVYLGDVGGSPSPEIVAAGDQIDALSGGIHIQWVAVFTYSGSSLSLSTQHAWGGDSIAYSVHALDVDNDNSVEIVTAGFNRTLTTGPRYGNLTVWRYTGSVIVIEDSDAWQLNSREDTVFYGVFNANIDNDANSVMEIVACGFHHDATANEDQGILRIYRHDGTTVSGVKYTTWDSGAETVCRSVHAANLDADGYLEMSAGGWALISNLYNAEIQIFEWRGGTNSITTETGATQWYTTGNTKANSVYNADADNDGTVEVASGGFQSDGSHDRGELRVWHL